MSGVSPEVVAGQVTARLRFGEEKPAGLRQSQRLSVRIFIDRRDNVLMVDRGAFVDQEGGGFAYVVHGNVAERRPVRLGAESITKVEILEGLAVGRPDRHLGHGCIQRRAARHLEPLTQTSAARDHHA